MLQHLEEIRWCSTEIDNAITEMALLKVNNPAVLSEALLKIYRLNRRILAAQEKIAEIQREYSKRRQAAIKREARKRGERADEEE